MNNDFISRSELLEFAHNHVGGTVDCNDIARFPSVDAEPVRHGWWDKVQVWKDNPHTTLKCSACKTWQPIYEHDNWDYCPFCGAKMDAEVEG